jgi:hypothetical protein
LIAANFTAPQGLNTVARVKATRVSRAKSPPRINLQLRAVDFTTAANDNFFLLAGDAT